MRAPEIFVASDDSRWRMPAPDFFHVRSPQYPNGGERLCGRPVVKFGGRVRAICQLPSGHKGKCE